ncbi:hypothetical protein [Desulfoluna limicola]|nr:hypothetical protein [Desulfoluna limicola]
MTALLIGTFCLATGCAGHVIRTHESVSRDTTWIQFTQKESPFVVNGLVGGEHISQYRLLGFEGERYRITGRGEDLYMNIFHGNGADAHGTGDTYVVAVIDLDALITVELSAHPVSQYQLRIEKIK